jgi:RNA polymerase sigma-70 factor (ECF subfamily)
VTARIDDRILLEAARDGDVDAFAALVRRHHAAIYRVALRMLGSDADAQDAVQDTFVRAWRSLARFRGESAVSTWLYRIVTRRCLDLIAGRRPAEELRDADHVTPADPTERAEQRERLQAVLRAISRLPGDQRAVLVLREFEGLAYDQVAEALDITVPAVKGRLHRARRSVLEEATRWR